MAVCRCTLKTMPEDGFSAAGKRAFTDGRSKVPHQLDFNRKDLIQHRADQVRSLSISGVQDKISVRLERNRFLPVTSGGEFILKPIPGNVSLKYVEAVPANEHLTMQLAGQGFGIQIPACALVDLADGEPAYMVRRFDRDKDGRKRLQEDFCQLANRSEDTHGQNYKYDATQEETGRLLKRYCGTYAVQVEDLFRRHIFNYVFSNGDAHLKNFSLVESRFGDHILSPAYDLLCTGLHLPNEFRCALDMFEGSETPFFKKNGFYGRPDFLLLADRFGLKPDIAILILNEFQQRTSFIEHLVKRSFLPKPLQQRYLDRMEDRLLAIR
jgi:serine/threonine-protein kinase HipA